MHARTIEERFWPKVDKSGECWLWTGYRQPKGYGLINAGGRGGTPLLVHRVSYALCVGEIPDKAEIDHLCRVRHCVNPAHLEAVTHAENVGRGDYTANHRNLVKTHCIHGHGFTSVNTYINARGWRMCRTCHRTRMNLIYDTKHPVVRRRRKAREV